MRYRIQHLTFDESEQKNGIYELPYERVVVVLEKSRVRINPDKWYVTVLVELTD